MNRIGKFTSVLLGAAAIVAVTAVSAQAAPLRAWACTAPAAGCTLIVDNGINDSSGVLGAIVFVGPTGNFELAVSYPFAGTPADPFLNLTYVAGGLTAPLYLYATQDQFTYTGDLSFLANATAGSGLATVFAATGLFAGPPGVPGNSPAGCSALVYNDTPVDAQCSFSAPTPEYFLAIRLDVTPNAQGVASGDATIKAVPEPASMAVFGLGLLGAGLAARRRRQLQ